jgi:hypothetical protein
LEAAKKRNTELSEGKLQLEQQLHSLEDQVSSLTTKVRISEL